MHYIGMWAGWVLKMVIFAKGPSINDVYSEGEGGGQKSPILLSKKTTKGEGGHKIGKMGRRRLWMAPKTKKEKRYSFLT